MVSLYSLLALTVIVWLAPILISIAACVSIIGYAYRYMNPIKDSDYPILGKLRNAVIAHRAAAKANAKNAESRAPENTLEAFDDAKRLLGVNSVEFDVRCTMDGIPVVFHDEVLGQTLDVSPEDQGRGIKDFTFNQIREMKFLDHHTGASSLNAYVPSLDEVVLRCKALGLNMMIEIKPMSTRRDVHAIVDVILKNDMCDMCYIASFSPKVLFHARVHGEGRICTGFLFASSTADMLNQENSRQGRIIPPLVQRLLSLAPVCGFVDTVMHLLGSPLSLHILGHKIAAVQHPYVSQRIARRYRDAGITLLAWTYDEGSEAVQRAHFVDHKISLITDFPVADLIAVGTDSPTRPQDDEDSKKIK